MKLHELVVQNYGPLDQAIDFDGGLHVVFGPNESGKTLIVDALLLLLTGENEDDRVGQLPHGYVTLDEGDQIRRLDQGETILDRLVTVLDIDLTPHTFRNSFVIRSADSALDDEDRYYDRATDVVAESLVEDIQSVEKQVAKDGRITKGNRKLWDRQTDGYVETHRDRSRDLAENLKEFKEWAEAEDVPTLEARLFRAEREVRSKQNQVKELEAAETKQRIEIGRDRRRRLKKELEKREQLPDESTLESLEDQVEKASQAAEEAKSLELGRDRAYRLATRLAYGTLVLLLVGAVISAWSLSLLGVSVVTLFGAGLFTAVLAVVPAATSLFYWNKHRAAFDRLDDMTTTRTDVLRDATRFGIDAPSLTELRGELDRLKSRRNDLTESITDHHYFLRNNLDLSTETPSETLEVSDDVLKQLETALDAESDIDFAEEKLEEAQKQLEKLEERRKELEDELSDYRGKISSRLENLEEIPFTQYGLEQPTANVRTIDGLDQVIDRLNELIEKIETDADNARAAMDILESLERDERGAVEELFFGAESVVSEYFSTITDGRYESVNYDETSNSLEVKRDSGITLSPAELSQATFDQLYFSVRVAFAKQLLDPHTGFLVLDDAFLASDSTRLQRQGKILKDLQDEGWQIAYFTAQQETKDSLSTISDTEIKELDQLG